MDGLTTNGVLVMHPSGGFSEDSTPGVWREISVCGNVYALRDSRSAQQRGKLVSGGWKGPQHMKLLQAQNSLTVSGSREDHRDLLRA
uniref:Pellino FHA domain-containing protein n=1 Tax=Sphenodon punctatus TaxID=8508 RepID=A0A8D0GS80_SPHPU